MGHTLLWIEFLAFALLALALGVAASGHAKRPRLCGALLLSALLLVTVVGVILITLAASLATAWTTYVAGWTLCFAGGGAAMMWLGLGKKTPEGLPAATSWPRARLALGAGIALLLNLMTLSSIDGAVRLHLVSMRSEASALALSVAPPRVADADNAALVYERAFERMKAVTVPEQVANWHQPKANDGFDPANPLLEKALTELRPALDLLHRGAAMPHSNFSHDWGRPSYDMLLPELADLRAAARWLALEARTQTERGDTQTALVAVRTIYGLARHLREDSPFLIGWLVACAIDGMGNQALEHALSTGRATEADLLPLLAEDAASYQNCFARSLRMEEAFGLSAFADLGDESSGLVSQEALGAVGSWSLPHMLFRIFLLSDDARSYREIMTRGQDAARKPFTQAKERWQELEQIGDRGGFGFLTRLLVPALGSAARTGARTDARRRLARTAVAMELARLRRGSQPESLATLVPEFLDVVPTDPFDDQPLRLVSKDGTTVLYSIGENGTDDGGVRDPEYGNAGDLVFALPVLSK